MDYKNEVEKRVQYIRDTIASAHSDGVILGNSGGKDCTLVSILCKMATPNVYNVIMPCESSINYGQDRDDAWKVSKQFDIETVEVDITEAKRALKKVIEPFCGDKSTMHFSNMNPRLRMITLYTIAQSRNLLVAGTGNLCENVMGYFTKWGDGAYDFNPIYDLKVSEVYGMLEYLGAPECIIKKVPSAGLYEGQTDEKEMGVTYTSIENFIDGKVDESHEKIARVYARTAHKRRLTSVYNRVELNPNGGKKTNK